MKSSQLFLLSLLTALLLAFAWFPNGFVPLLFIAFVPLLMVEQQISKHPHKYHSLTLFFFTYSAFLVWNILTTWWIKNASFGGATMAITCNALLMTITFMLFHNVKKRIGNRWQHILFIGFWITFEFLHHDWDLTWTWLTLGNAFADTPSWIQWYEYTGVFGGSFWVLFTNSFVFSIIAENQNLSSLAVVDSIKKNGLKFIACIALPIIVSYSISTINIKFDKFANVVIVQPNIDPYNEKFVLDYEQQLNKMLQLAAQKIDAETDYVIFPETALTESIWENQINQSSSIYILKQFLKAYPRLKIVVGASTSKMFEQDEALSTTARKFSRQEGYYDAYNTAIQLDTTGFIQLYHKSRLVPGVEKMPFPFIFKYLGDFAIDLGGTAGSLGTQDERSVFVSDNEAFSVAPIICYESVYGEFVSEYIKNGASFIAIITNDGWWGDTPGYRQHLKYGTLRAIETRRYIARSANTGISCVITPKGDIEQATAWWQPAVIKAKIGVSNQQTFYVKYGDYIGRFAMYLSFGLIIYSWILLLRKRIKS